MTTAASAALALTGRLARLADGEPLGGKPRLQLLRTQSNIGVQQTEQQGKCGQDHTSRTARPVGGRWHGPADGLDVGCALCYAGSYPPRLQGWQRSIRRTARHEPRQGPYFRTASIAYWLHVGWKRHCPPSNRPSVTRYSNTRKMSRREAIAPGRQPDGVDSGGVMAWPGGVRQASFHVRRSGEEAGVKPVVKDTVFPSRSKPV